MRPEKFFVNESAITRSGGLVSALTNSCPARKIAAIVSGNITGRLLLLTASLVLSLGLSEVLLRAYLSKTQGASPGEWKAFAAGQDIAPNSRHALAAITRVSANRGMIYELKPGISVDFGGYPVRINSIGARSDREYPAGHPPGGKRILTIGDSGMFGWDVSQGQEYPGLLETSLRRRTNGVVYEVINMAVPGYNTRQEVETLKERGLALKPDIVVVGWCVNDFGLPFFMERPRNHWRTRTSYLFALAFNRTRFAELLAPEVVKTREISQEMMPAEVLSKRGPEGMRKTLAELKALADEHKFKVLLFGPMHLDIMELCRDAGIEYFNTLKEIPPERYPKTYWIHRMHPRPEGHRVLAENLERALDGRGWLAEK